MGCRFGLLAVPCTPLGRNAPLLSKVRRTTASGARYVARVVRMTQRILKVFFATGEVVPDTFEDWLRFLDGQLRSMLQEAVTYGNDIFVWRYARGTERAMEQVWEHRRTGYAKIFLSDALESAGGLNDRLHVLRRETLHRAKLGIEVWCAKGTTDFWAFEATYGKVTKVPDALAWANGMGLGATMNRLRSQGFQLTRVP
jgi:hypothetical protein